MITYYSLCTQLKSAETDREALQEQLSNLHEAYSQEVVDLAERLEKYKRKYSDKKQQSLSKLNTSKYVQPAGINL